MINFWALRQKVDKKEEKKDMWRVFHISNVKARCVWFINMISLYFAEFSA